MKKIIAIFIGMMGAMLVQAQDMKSLFIAMPDSVAPLLTKVNREDCIDFLDSNMKAEVKNRFGRPSELKKLTKDYLFMQTTPQSSMEMKLLPLNDSTQVICVVNTVCAPACDSRVRFFSTGWNELPVQDFILFPSAEVFYLPSDSSEAYTEACAKADMELLKITLSPENETLSCTYATPDYLAKEDKTKLEAYLGKSSVVYQWVGGKFAITEGNK